MMTYTPGTRLRSQVCDGQFIIVRAAPGDADLTCGGRPVIALDAPDQPRLDADPSTAAELQLGKRYTNSAGEVEVLVTKPAAFGLALGGEPLVMLQSKPLPSSD